MNEKIIMFDMDGTLLDLAFDDMIWNQQLPLRHAQTHQCSLEQSKDSLFAYYQEYKHTLAWYSSRAWTAKVGVDVLELQYELQEHIQMRPGCLALLDTLKKHGYQCWLLTNADVASLELKMKNVNLSDFFEVMVSSEQLQYAKEDQGFWQTLQQLHPFEPAQCVFVDDTMPVLAAAEQFGIGQLVTILQPSSLNVPRIAAELDYPAIQDLTELLPLIKPTLQLKESHA